MEFPWSHFVSFLPCIIPRVLPTTPSLRLSLVKTILPPPAVLGKFPTEQERLWPQLYQVPY